MDNFYKNVGEGTELSKKCQCGNMVEVDLSKDCLYYPCLGETIDIYMHCDECGAEYEDALKIRLTMDLEVVDEK